MRGFFVGEFRGFVAVALADAGGHKVRTQHTGADLVGDQLEILVERLAQAHHRVLADVVNAHVGWREQAGHAGGVDDVATVGGVGLGRSQHHRREQAHPMDHPPHIHTQHPLPVLDRVLPDQATRAHASVVEDEVRRAKPVLHRIGQRRHLVGAGHIHPPRQHLGTRGLDLGFGLVQRILLHIDQHEVHAPGRADACALQAKPRACSGQYRRLAFEILNHECVSLV